MEGSSFSRLRGTDIFRSFVRYLMSYDRVHVSGDSRRGAIRHSNGGI